MRRLFLFITVIWLCSCRPSRCLVYNLNDYKDEFGHNYIPRYDPSDAEWQRADYILREIVAPAKWRSKRHRICGLEYSLYVLTSERNHKKIQRALPTLWHP